MWRLGERMKLIFMGTSEFAVPILNRLSQSVDYQLVTVVTQPDRPKGRGLKRSPTPIKVAAQALGLSLWQPQTLQSPQAVAYLTHLQPDLIIVAAFGQYLPKSILALPTYGCLNLHPSLLPCWRGPAPVASAIYQGDAETGVSLILMDEGLDTGPIIAQQALSIQQDHTTQTLTKQLSTVASSLLCDTLPDYLAGNLQPQPQNHHHATLSVKLCKQDGHISWKYSSDFIQRHIRAMIPWPIGWTDSLIGRIRIFSAETFSMTHSLTHSLTPGTIYRHQHNVYVATGDGLLGLGLVQLEGRKSIPAIDLLNGYPQLLHTTFY